MRLLTTDIYEGAYLLSQNMHLEKLWLKGSNGKRSVVFEFSGCDIDLLRSYYEKGLAETNVTKLKQSLTELKDKMFNLIRTQPAAMQAETERRQNYGYQLASLTGQQ